MKNPRRYKYQSTDSAEITPREDEVISLIKTAASNRDIANELNISEETVKRHLSNIFDKLGVFTRLELMLRINQRDGKFEMERDETMGAVVSENARLTAQVSMLQRQLQHVRGLTASKTELPYVIPAVNTRLNAAAPR